MRLYISRSPEHGTTVVYADCFTPDEERRRAERDGDEPNAIPFLKRFTVFDADQLLAAVRP